MQTADWLRTIVFRVRKQWPYCCHVLICIVKTIVRSLHFTLTGLSTWEEGLNHYLMSHAEQSTLHVLAGCSALAQTKYLARHNSLWVAEKKIDNIPPWFSPMEPKPDDENQRAKAYLDVLVHLRNTEVRVNKIDVRKLIRMIRKSHY